MSRLINAYYVDIDGEASDEGMRLYARKADEGILLRGLLMPSLKRCEAGKTRFLYLCQSDYSQNREDSLKEDLRDFFGAEVILTRISPHDEDLEFDPQLCNAEKAACGGMIRKDCENRWRIVTVAQALSEAEQLLGFGEFKEAMHKLDRYIRNSRLAHCEPHCGVVLVKNCGVNEDIFIDHLYDLLLAEGVILEPSVASGDLRDASETNRDSAFLYRIDEDWERSGHSRYLPMTHQARMLQKLAERRTIYVTSVNAKVYEALKDDVRFRSVFPCAIKLEEPSVEDKFGYLAKEASTYGFSLTETAFGSSNLAKLPLEELKARVAVAVRERLSAEQCGFTLSLEALKTKEINTEKHQGPALEELDKLIGLAGVKACVREISAFVKSKGADSLPTLHMVFRGNPGAGKTTVARLLGRILAEAGALKRDDVFVEADRNSLVSIYLGGTAEKTASTVKSALGGVLFIDEAYSLFAGEGRDYGAEAVAELVKMMEDHRRDFVCILAGYPKQMDAMLDMNPGLRSRIQFYLDFEDYDADEMMQIFSALASQYGYETTAGATETLQHEFAKITRRKNANFANGRTVRSVFERVRMKQALREGAENIIREADIEAVFAERDVQNQLGGLNRERTLGF
jgi:hypothetical protein